MHMMMKTAKSATAPIPAEPCCKCGTLQGALNEKGGRPRRFNVGRFGISGPAVLACHTCYQWYLRYEKAAKEGRLIRTHGADADNCAYLPDEATLRREREARLAADLDVESRDMKRTWATQSENAARAKDERARIRAEREAKMSGTPRVNHQLGCLPFEDFDAMVKVRSIGRAMFTNTVKRNPELWGAAFG